MVLTLQANFPDAAQAEKALGALLDRGAHQADLSAVFPRGYFSSHDPAVDYCWVRGS